jgi:hypothetical protein
MARGRLTFRQRDVAAAIRAARQAGLNVSKVKISPQGEIEIITTDGPVASNIKPNPWDRFYEDPAKLR